MRVGLLDLDTSHPEAFTPLIQAHGFSVTSVFNSGAVLDAEHTEKFAARHGIERVCTSIAELVDRVQIVFVHTVDWDQHVDRLAPLVDAGVGVFICKPIAGNVTDLERIEAWTAAGAKIFGGSALRWSASATPIPGAHSGWVSTFGHPFDYGIHAFSFAQGLVGPGIVRARALDEAGRRSELSWDDGRSVIVDVLPETAGYGFHAAIAGNGGVHHRDASADDLYGPFVIEGLRYLSSHDEAPVSFAELVEPERCAIATRASAQSDGAWVNLRDDDRLSAGAWSAAPFAKEYAHRRRAALGITDPE